MLFKCLKSDLQAALQEVVKAVSIRTTLPILTGILFKVSEQRLVMKATDLEISIIKEMEIKGVEEGELVIPARTILEIIKSLPEGVVEFKMKKSEGKVEIKSEKISYEVNTFTSEDFPKVERKDKNGLFEIKAKRLKEGIGQVIKAISKDETRPVLTGVLMYISSDGYKMVATDSYRLSIRECKEKIKTKEDKKVLIPGRALGELSKLLKDEEKVGFLLEENSVIWDLESTQLQTRIIEGNFPDYTQLLPKEVKTNLEVNKEKLLNSIKRVSIVSREDPLKIKIEKDKITITAESKDIGKAVEEIDAKIKGDPLEIAFNPGYIVDGIEGVAGEIISLEIQDKLKPCAIKGKEGKEYIYVVMPVRVG
ncbi:MAG: DNA polymerase III subunit beta [Actinomycetia bacterium]|nr:DNA polymerase III subunit beta [Actinomycetes bacterium]